MPTNTPITRYRGDDRPLELNVVNMGAVQPITGFSFELTVNAKAAPVAADAAEFTSTGTIMDADAGLVHFPISAAAAALLGRFYHTIRMTDASGKSAGIINGTYLALPTAEPPA